MTNCTIILGKRQARIMEISNSNFKWIENYICEIEVVDNKLHIYLPNMKPIITSAIEDTCIAQPVFIVKTHNSRYSFELL